MLGSAVGLLVKRGILVEVTGSPESGNVSSTVLTSVLAQGAERWSSATEGLNVLFKHLD